MLSCVRLFGENLPNQIDVLAEGINQIGKTERHVQLAGLIERIETGAIVVQLGDIKMMVEVILEEFQLAVAAENLERTRQV
jgi:hypothetical protein